MIMKNQGLENEEFFIEEKFLIKTSFFKNKECSNEKVCNSLIST